MKLTKKEAIKRHRLMWEWIAEETLSRQKCFDKLDAFKHFGWKSICEHSYCWCCKYDDEHGHNCRTCPIKWPSKNSLFACIKYDSNFERGIFDIWCRAVESNDWRKAAYYAFYISMLPERKD